VNHQYRESACDQRSNILTKNALFVEVCRPDGRLLVQRTCPKSGTTSRFIVSYPATARAHNLSHQAGPQMHVGRERV
jgi:hypothetical protein